MVFSRTEISQFMKVPSLVQHYLEHQKEDGMSFMEFIAMHYQEGNKHLDPHHHDLPFKAHQCHHFNQTDILDFHSLALGKELAQVNKPVPAYREAFYNSTLLSSIWQPPQA